MKNYLREKIYRFISLAFREEIIRDGFRGILGREPEEEALAAYQSSFKELGYEGLMNELSRSPEAWNKQKREHAEELIREVFRGILGREPEEEALTSYKEGFGSLKVEGVIKDLVGSEEHWQKIQTDHAEDIIREIYRGILEREPEECALFSHAEHFKNLSNGKVASKRLHFTLTKFIESEEFYCSLNKNNKIWINIKNKLLTSVYLGLVGRIPHDKEKEVYSEKLKVWDDLSLVISSIALGPGQDNKLSSEISKEIFTEICEHLLKRKLPSNEIEQSIPSIGKLSSFGDLIKVAISKYTQEEAHIKRRNSPSKIINPKRIIFLHAEKTGGTSVQAMLAKSLNRKDIFCEHDDTLYWRTPSEIDQYKVLCGHFNYDTTKLLSTGNNHLVTMVRNPERRILSLYNFWRSHHESHPNHTIYHSIAWQMGLEEFLKDKKIVTSRHVWNNMAWYIAGDKKWNEWREINILPESQQSTYLEEIVTPFLRKRMAMFSVIGIQEKFSESVEKIYQLLNMKSPTHMLKENTFEGNIACYPHFREDITPKNNISNNERIKIEEVTKIDKIIYQIAINKF
jgi:hypothetical protein